MRREEQQGMASIVVVSVLIVILTLISIGFARMMNRSAIDSANKQFSASATYAAESGINDVAAYLKQYAQANPGLSYLPKSTNCTGPNSLIGDDAHKDKPFYSDSNLSGETDSYGKPVPLSDRTTKYTCILLNPNPNSLAYGPVFNLKSQVVKVNTSASAGALEKLMISWRPSNKDVTGYPSSSSSLSDETTWNSPTAACKDSSSTNADCLPLLRVTIYPVTNGEALTSAQATSKTVFLYPQSPAGNVPIKSFTDPSLKDGSIVPVPCTQSVGANDFNPSTSAPYVCNIIISSLSSALSPASTDSVYLRLTPIYNQADIEVQANDKYGNNLTFINDQAVIDVTAQTAGVAKRLQARVDTSSLVNGATGTDTNISSGSDAEPEQALRTAVSLCKREIQTTTSIGFSSYVNFDDADGICHDLNGTTTTTNPVPTLAFSITGLNGSDNNRTVDSETNNPDSPQNPVQKGTVYVGSSPGSGDATARINWSTTDATSCTAGGAWSGEKNGDMNFTGNPPTNGTGYRNNTFTVGSVTSYTMQCSRPYAPSATPTKTVTIWPYPVITGLSSSSARAGKNYTVSWSSNNAKPNGCVLTGGNWSNPGNTNNSDSETMNWPVNDNSTDRAFTVTCYDPIGRSDSRTIHVNPNGGDTGGGGSGVAPPYCSASVWTGGSTTQDATISWSTSCPDWDPSNICQPSRDIEPSANMPNYFSGYFQGIGSPCWQSSGTIHLTSPGTYSLTASVWASPWKGQSDANSTGCSSSCDGAARASASITVGYPQVVIDYYNVKAWDNGPYECGSKTSFNNQWMCRNGSPVEADAADGGNLRAEGTGGGGGWGCADADHRFGVCGGEDYWYVHLADGSTGGITCNEYSTNGFYHSQSGGGSQSSGPWQWKNVGGVYPFTIKCDGPTPGPGGSSTNHAEMSYNG